MKCQCEHERHLDEDPQHWDHVEATSKARLLYGTYFLCEPCDTNCYSDGDRVAPSTPMKEVKYTVTIVEERRIAYKLLGILMEYAPDDKSQVACSNLYNSLPHAKPHEIVRHLACALVDGLQYGNWPWVKPGEPA